MSYAREGGGNGIQIRFLCVLIVLNSCGKYGSEKKKRKKKISLKCNLKRLTLMIITCHKGFDTHSQAFHKRI